MVFAVVVTVPEPEEVVSQLGVVIDDSRGGVQVWLRGGTYPLPHLYGHFGLVRLCRLGHDVPWVKA